LVNFREKYTLFTCSYSRKLAFENYAKIAAGLKATKVIGKSPYLIFFIIKEYFLNINEIFLFNFVR